MVNKLANIALTTTGLAIKAGSSALAKVGSAFAGKFKGQIIDSIAAGDLPSLTFVGTVKNGTKTLIAVYSTVAGVFSFKTLEAGIVNSTNFDSKNWPNGPELHDNGLIFLGLISINATSADFVGGSTALDAGTVTAKYYDAFNINGLIFG